jgi:predicted cupin superfamily sugar epimerase
MRNGSSQHVCLNAFYFLLHMGEFTAYHKEANTRIVQFRAKDVTFWDLDLCVIPNDASEPPKTLHCSLSYNANQ